MRVIGTTTDTYAYSSSANQISTVTTGSNVRSFTYTASRQVSQDVRDSSHTYTFAVNDNGRNAGASLNGSAVGSYLYNAFEQRVQKVAGSTTTQFVYDTAGHLLQEANSSGVAQKEYIWLDDLPVAIIDPHSSPGMFFIHTDQLGTPQKITDGSTNVVWDGQYDPFGNMVAVSGTIWGANWGGFSWEPTTGTWGAANWGSFAWEPGLASSQFLRFPGQYADAETALNQNWNRDYDPTVGRYLQSDPIGLNSGVNIYNYSLSNPVRFIDPQGKEVIGVVVGGALGAAYGALGAYSAGGDFEDIATSAAIGGAVGAAVGLLELSLGIGTVAVLSGGASSLGDLVGQELINISNHRPITCINFGSTVGAIIGGAIGGRGGAYLYQLGAPYISSKLALTVISTSISSGPSTLLGPIGSVVSKPAH